LRPGRPRKHLGIKLFDPLCAACNLFFLHHLQGRLCCSRACGLLTGGPRTAHYHRSHTEPSISEEGNYVSTVIDRGTAPLRACGLLKEEPRIASAELSISKEGTFRARNGRLNFVLTIRLRRNRKRFLTYRTSATRDPQFYFPSEGRHVYDFLRPKK
jgi:hypothetical protein